MAKTKYRDEEMPLPAHVGEQIVVPVPEHLDDELSLDKPCCKSLDELLSEEPDRKLPMTDADHEEIQRQFAKRHRRQFTVRELFALMTIFAIAVSLVNWLPREAFGFVMGMAALISLIVGCTLPAKSRLLHILWCSLLFLYVMAAVLILAENFRGS